MGIFDSRTPVVNLDRATPHLLKALDEALGLDDEGHALGRVLDLFLFREVRGAVDQVLGVKVSNGNGG